MHNPETIRLPDGKYALSGMRNEVYLADKMEVPWERSAGMKMDTRGFRAPGSLGANMTFSLRPDGSILVFRKNGDVTVSNTGISGPYKIIAIDNYESNDGYSEDPVIWRSRHQYHVIYNKAQLERTIFILSSPRNNRSTAICAFVPGAYPSSGIHSPAKQFPSLCFSRTTPARPSRCNSRRPDPFS